MLTTSGLGIFYSPEEKVFLNYVAIRTLESKKIEDRPQVALIRGRQLFVIRPDNWKGWNILNQIWFIFNRIIYRYQSLEKNQIEMHPLRKATLQTYNQDAYKQWMASHLFVGEDKSAYVEQLKEELDLTKTHLGKSSQHITEQAAEIARIKRELDHWRHPPLITENHTLTVENEKQKKEIEALKEKPALETRLEYLKILKRLESAVDKERTYSQQIGRYLFNTAADKHLKPEEILAKVRELYKEKDTNQRMADWFKELAESLGLRNQVVTKDGIKEPSLPKEEESIKEPIKEADKTEPSKEAVNTILAVQIALPRSD